MKRRCVGRRTGRLFDGGSLPLVVLTALLVVVSGPGAAASQTQTLAQGYVSPAGQADPVAGLAADLQYDPEQIFRFVADDILYEPYAGELRGAAGTIRAGAGNSVDKAILLAALLGDSQVSYRFARGALDQATTERILQTLPKTLELARDIARAPLTQGLVDVAGPDSPATEASGPLATLYQQQAEAVAADATKRLEAAKTRLRDTVKVIESALGGAGVELGTATEVSLPPSEAADHTWVEMANGAEWVDLDPTLAGAQAGAALTHAAETLDQLPDDLRYKVDFDVLVEQASGDSLVTDSVLTYSDFADQLSGTPVTFAHTTPSGLKNLGVAISSLLGEGWLDYRPTLQVGGQTYISDDAVAFPTTAGGGGIFDEEPSPGAGPLDGEATAEWLQVQVTPPGSAPQVAKRTIFDRLPAELRAAGQLTPSAVEPIELVDFKGTGSSDFMPLLGQKKFVVATGPTSPSAVTATDDQLAKFALAYLDLRDSIDAEVALDAGARTFDDGPNIVSVNVEASGDPEAPSAQVGLDIWQRNHGVLPLAGSTLTPAQSRLVAGVTDHVAERLAVEGLADTTASRGGSLPPQATVGVSDIFEAAAANGVGTVVLHGEPPASLPYDAIATGLIKDALARGDVVVVPAEPVAINSSPRIGWWTVDPRTGATTDVMDVGSGAELVEEALIIDSEFGRLICFGAMAAQAAAMIIAAASLLGSFGASSIFWTFEEGVGGTTCAAA